MIILTFLAGMLIYSLGTELMYSEYFKKLSYYPAIGVSLGMGANFVWYNLVQKINDKDFLLKLGLYWDVMIVACFLAIPMIFHGVRPSASTNLGIAFIVLGIVLTKLK